MEDFSQQSALQPKRTCDIDYKAEHTITDYLMACLSLDVARKHG